VLHPAALAAHVLSEQPCDRVLLVGLRVRVCVLAVRIARIRPCAVRAEEADAAQRTDARRDDERCQPGFVLHVGVRTAAQKTFHSGTSRQADTGRLLFARFLLQPLMAVGLVLYGAAGSRKRCATPPVAQMDICTRLQERSHQIHTASTRRKDEQRASGILTEAIDGSALMQIREDDRHLTAIG
jgi:hypothetical protein